MILLLKKISELLEVKKIRFLIAGGLNTIFGLALFPMLFIWCEPLHLHYLVLLTVSQLVCVTFAFLTNRYFVFKSSGRLVKQYLTFCSFYYTYFLFNLLLLPLIVEGFSFSPIYTQLVISVFIVLFSYFFHNKVTFAQG